MKKTHFTDFLKCITFISGLILIIAVSDYLFAQTGYVRYILHDLNSEATNYDALFLGASHARSAISPEITDKYTGDNALNLAIPAETLKDSYYLLEEALRTNDVKRVIFEADYQYWFGDQYEGFATETFIYNQLSWSSPYKWQYMFDNKDHLEFRNALSKRSVYKYDMNFVIHNVKNKQTDDYKKANIYSLNVPDAQGPYVGRGFFKRVQLNGPAPSEHIEIWKGRENNPFAENMVDYFEKMLDLCRKNDIELICITAPVTPSSSETLGFKEVDRKLSEYFAYVGVPYYNFNKCRLDVLPRTDKDFVDWDGHMCGELAESFSAVLGEVISKHDKGTLVESDYFYNDMSDFFNDFKKISDNSKEVK